MVAVMNGANPKSPENVPSQELATIRIDGALHKLLKAKADAEGRILKRMVEDQLRPLVEIQPVGR